ncbi:CsbD family protein [Edaphobacter sp. HDX4]|uniref:CsbD family protein n=1 Tax=Edaphobacter sp. HDX4 TaxID=2794064 RepID=UPI002FE61EB8
MNKDTVEGKFDQVSGAIKQKVGEAVNDQSLANSGAAEQIKGDAKETWGNAKDVADEKRADAAARSEARTDSTRDRVVDNAQNMKDNINAKLDDMRDRH